MTSVVLLSVFLSLCRRRCSGHDETSIRVGAGARRAEAAGGAEARGGGRAVGVEKAEGTFLFYMIQGFSEGGRTARVDQYFIFFGGH